MVWTAPNKGKTSSAGQDTAWKGVNNNGRQAMGTSLVSEFVNFSAKYTSPLLQPRLKGTAPGNVGTAGGPKNNVKQIQSMGGGETIGPSFVPKATRPPMRAEAQATMANTRFTLPSVTSRANFYGQ